jgi:hypothetical protein
MSPALLHLARTQLLPLCVGLAACTTAPVPSPPKSAAKPEHKKDYSALRIDGRETLKLPGFGVIHADKRADVEDGVLLSGRVFLEISLPASGDKPMFLYAYAERARSNSKRSILCLEGLAIVEGARIVIEGTKPDTRIFFDETGKVTTKGAHTQTFY